MRQSITVCAEHREKKIFTKWKQENKEKTVKGLKPKHRLSRICPQLPISTESLLSPKFQPFPKSTLNHQMSSELTNSLRSEPLRSNHFHKTLILDRDAQVINLSTHKPLRDISHMNHNNHFHIVMFPSCTISTWTEFITTFSSIP